MTEFYANTIAQVADLIPYAMNSRTHSDEQVAQLAASIREFGFTNPVLIDEENNLIAGHGRVLAARKLKMDQVPAVVVTGLDENRRRALVIADNKLALNADWDEDKLLLELQSMTVDMQQLAGFSQDELLALLKPAQVEGLTDEDAVPEVPEDPVTVLGDVWLLGRHRVMCGDSTSIDAVGKLMDGRKAALLQADPPYGMGKEGDGVANDNLYRDKLDSFQMEWWATIRTFLDDNASAYIWGNAPDLWRLWYRGGLADSERLTIRNQIVWDKKHGQGMNSEGFRSFPTATEHCLFFMLGEQGFNNNADNYWEGFEPIRAYLDGEREKAGWTNKVVAGFFGFHQRMADHWFSKSQWSFPKRDQYERMKAEAAGAAFGRDYDDLKRDHDDLKRDFYGTRAYFDNAHAVMHDVWDFPRVSGDERHGHATPKPVAMMERVMKSSLLKDGLCVEPFGGSGSTLIGAEKAGRICYAMEIHEKYCDVIVKRWQDYTGETATHAESGKAFDEVAA